jgi:hypothetical protein
MIERINRWGAMNALRDTCAACTQPYSIVLGTFLHTHGCPAIDPNEYVRPRHVSRALLWRATRRHGRWTPMRARLFRLYLLWNWAPYLDLKWRLDLRRYLDRRRWRKASRQLSDR